MNDAELEGLIQDHYRNEAQTLTNGAEANLLKFREITSTTQPTDLIRWEEIKKTFRKNQLLGGADGRDPVTQVVQQLSACFDGIQGIREAIAAGLQTSAAPSIAPTTVILTSPNIVTSASTGPDGDGQSSRVEEVAISQDALRHIRALIEEQKARPADN